MSFTGGKDRHRTPIGSNRTECLTFYFFNHDDTGGAAGEITNDFQLGGERTGDISVGGALQTGQSSRFQKTDLE